MKDYFSKFCNSLGVKRVFGCLMLLLFMLPVYGKDILLNGNFSDGLLHWKFGSDSGASVIPFRTGGPGGGPFIRLTSLGGSVSCSQLYCGMPKNEKFKISCMFRIREISPDAQAEIVILCLPDKHYLPLKGEVGKWVKFEQIFTSTNGGNYLSFQLKNGPGVLDIARASIEPLAADTRSSDMMEHASQALVPMANMHALTPADKLVRFQYSGKFPQPEKDLLAVFYVKENPRRALRLPVSKRTVMVDMGKFGSKSGTLLMALQDKNTGREYLSAEYPFKFIEPVKAENAVKLNNLVTELFNGPLPGKLAVKNPRYSWIYCRFIPDDPQAQFSIKLNGKEFITDRTLRHEAIRLCEAGVLNFEKSGMPEYPDEPGTHGKFILRLIPEIFVFPIGLNDWPGNGRFNWLFAKNFMLPALTTVSAGIPTSANVAEMHSMGLQWFNNCGIRAKNSEGMLADFNGYSFNWRGPCDGVSLDELTLGELGNMDRFAWALRKYKNPKDAVIHVWMTGGPVPANSNCFSAVINASRGRGRLLHEIYKHTQRSEKEAKEYWKNVRQGANVTRKILGEQAFRKNFSIILGLFNESPSISLNIYPHVDYKYFLEMQIRSLAMDKEFDGLSGVGFWGIHHATEEAVRWGFALYRHYAIEGRTDWLCEKYGFTYEPGLLQNPDFEEALSGWEANALVRSGNIKGLGSKVQHRYGAPAGVGDNVAVFSREENEYGELSQVMTGFVPGNVYAMTFYTANYKDLQENLHNPKRQPVSYTLDNAEILKNTRVVDRTKAGSSATSQKVRINTMKVIFKANSPEIKLTFDNRKALPGEETVLNGICVTPYFQKEKML